MKTLSVVLPWVILTAHPELRGRYLHVVVEGKVQTAAMEVDGDLKERCGCDSRGHGT